MKFLDRLCHIWLSSSVVLILKHVLGVDLYKLLSKQYIFDHIQEFSFFQVSHILTIAIVNWPFWSCLGCQFWDQGLPSTFCLRNSHGGILIPHRWDQKFPAHFLVGSRASQRLIWRDGTGYVCLRGFLIIIVLASLGGTQLRTWWLQKYRCQWLNQERKYRRCGYLRPQDIFFRGIKCYRLHKI